MAPLQFGSLATRDSGCESLSCLSETSKTGVALCIVFVTIGIAFTYYWAHIRGKLNKDDTMSDEGDPITELRVVTRGQSSPSHVRHYSTNQPIQITICRTTPVAQTTILGSPSIPTTVAAHPEGPVAGNVQTVANALAPQCVFAQPPTAPPYFGPPYTAPPLVDFALPGAPLVVPAPPTSAPGPVKYIDPRARQDVQPYLPEEPSPGYATTIPSDSGWDRGLPSPPTARRARRESSVRKTDRPRSSSPPPARRVRRASPARKDARHRPSGPPASRRVGKEYLQPECGGIRARSITPTPLFSPSFRQPLSPYPSTTTLGSIADSELEALLAQRIVSTTIDSEDAEYLARRIISDSIDADDARLTALRIINSSSNTNDIEARRIISDPTDTDDTKLAERRTATDPRNTYHTEARNPERQSSRRGNVLDINTKADEPRVGQSVSWPVRSPRAATQRSPHGSSAVEDSQVGRGQRCRESRGRRTRSHSVCSSCTDSSYTLDGSHTTDNDQRERRRSPQDRRRPPRVESSLRRFLQAGESRVGSCSRGQSRSKSRRSPNERRQEPRSRSAQTFTRGSVSQTSVSTHKGSGDDRDHRRRRSPRKEHHQTPRACSVFRDLLQAHESRTGEVERDRHLSRSRQPQSRPSYSSGGTQVHHGSPSHDQSPSYRQSPSPSPLQSPSHRNSPTHRRQKSGRFDYPQTTSIQQPQNTTSTESRESTTGAICSFDGSVASIYSPRPASLAAFRTPRPPTTAPRDNRYANAD